MNKIIDISHYDPIVDFAKAAAADIDGVYIKCTQGEGFVDPLCLTNATKAKTNRVKVGYYHFADTMSDPIAQAKFFKSRLSILPQSDLLPVLDIETNKNELSPEKMETWITTFLEAFENPMMIYSYQPFLDQYLPATHQLGKNPLWLAQYRNVDSPHLPKGWAKADLWQYSNLGHVDGVAAATVDLSKPLTDAFVINI